MVFTNLMQMQLQGRPLKLSAQLSRLVLYSGVAIAFCTYYLNYTVSFDEGQIAATTPLTIILRLTAVGLISISLMPFKKKHDASHLLVWLYFVAAVSYILSIIDYGSANDILFINTLIQLPVLIALSATTRNIDYCSLFKFVGCVLTLQVIGDMIIGSRGDALWLSGAFIGGVGNPSSLGFLCCLLVAFYLIYPRLGPTRWLFVAALSFGAVRSESLFSVLSLAIVFIYWAVQKRGRLILSSLIIGVLVIWITTSGIDVADGKLAFIRHKIDAASAFLGLMSYDVQSSQSVYGRLEMHYQTINAIINNPLQLFYGHLEGKPYWPMDSQVLTYLGSFGLVILIFFLGFHVLMIRQAASKKYLDYGFAFIGLVLFGFIFFTNRILDYFPVATVYFIFISMTSKSVKRITVRNDKLHR